LAMASCAASRSSRSWPLRYRSRSQPADEPTECTLRPTAPLVTSTGPTVEYFNPRASRARDDNRSGFVFELMGNKTIRWGSGSAMNIEMAHWVPVTSPIQTATATLHTNRGDIKIALFGNHAPKTVDNFVGLAQGTKDYSTQNATGGSTGPFYDGAVFHRVIEGFMLQGGDPTGTGRGGPGYQFADEFHPELVFDKPYLLAMANAGPGTNGSQFFITVGKTPHLNRKHTIFGEVVDPESQKVVDAIGASATDRSDRPVEPVVIESVTIS
jgi:peptidyl-prolyl cis-trans isomerase A (cyclophilin A)